MCSLFVLSVGTLTLFYTSKAIVEINSWYGEKVNIEILKNDWTVLYSDSIDICGHNIPTDSLCFANPNNPSLWNSKLKRTDKVHGKRVLSRLNEVYWIGVTISADKLNKAFNEEANVLLLGRMTGDYRIWIEGKQYFSALRSALSPTIVTLPMPRLLEKKDLKIAIQLFNNSQTGSTPDLIDYRYGAGFITKKKATNYIKHSFYWRELVKTVLTLIYLILALYTFYLWFKSRHKDTLFYLSFYLLTIACVNVYYIQTIWVTLDSVEKVLWKTPWFFYYSIFGLITTLSLTQVKKSFIYWICGISLVTPFVVLTIIQDDFLLQYKVQRFFRGNLSTCLSVVAGFICILRLYTLNKGKNYISKIKSNSHLFVCSIVFIFLGLINLITLKNPYSSMNETVWKWFLQFICFIILIYSIKKTIKDSKIKTDTSHK